MEFPSTVSKANPNALTFSVGIYCSSSGRSPANRALLEFTVLIELIQLCPVSATGAVLFTLTEPRTERLKGASSCARKGNSFTLEFISFYKRSFPEVGLKQERIVELARSRQPKSILLVTTAEFNFLVQYWICQVAGFLQLPLAGFKWCH